MHPQPWMGSLILSLFPPYIYMEIYLNSKILFVDQNLTMYLFESSHHHCWPNLVWSKCQKMEHQPTIGDAINVISTRCAWTGAWKIFKKTLGITIVGWFRSIYYIWIFKITPNWTSSSIKIHQNHQHPWKSMKNQWKPMKIHEKSMKNPWKSMKIHVLRAVGAGDQPEG